MPKNNLEQYTYIQFIENTWKHWNFTVYYNLKSSNIYKYWVTTVHAEVRKVHSGRISLTLKPFYFQYVLISTFPVGGRSREKEWERERKRWSN